MLKKVVFVVVLIFTASCGYHLRGAIDMPEEMRKIYVHNGSEQLVAAFAEILSYRDGALVAEDEAGLIINVIHEEMRRRAISLSGTGKANEFELHYVLDYQLLDNEKQALEEKQSLDMYRNYFNAQDQVIGKANEEQVIRNEMYTQAVVNIAGRAHILFKK